MRLITNINMMPECSVVATMGFFDGVHSGHQFLISETKRQAKLLGMKSAVITFDQHPRKVLQQEFQPKLLTNYQEKILLLERTDVDFVIVLPFTLELAKLSAEDFLHDYLYTKLHIKTLIVGHDHRFGHNRTNTFEEYQLYGEKLGMTITQVTAFSAQNTIVSSSVIRHCIQECDFRQAMMLLNHPYYISGIVEHGNKIGRTIGFPTANISVTDEKLLPPSGIYIVLCKCESSLYEGVMNIGTRPSIGDSNSLSIECHLFDFEGDLYGHSLNIAPLKLLRKEQKFNSLKELSAQISTDKLQALDYFQSENIISLTQQFFSL